MSVVKSVHSKLIRILRRTLLMFSLSKKPQHRTKVHQRPKGQKESDMKTLIKGFASLAILAALAACGGGGGDSPTTPPPAPSATYRLEITTTSVTIQADQSFAQATETWSTTNAGTVTLKDSASNTIGSGPSGSTVVNVPVGVATYTLYDGATAVKSVTITGTCVSGTSANGAGVCKAPVVAASWPPANITSTMATQVFGANQLPVGCNHAADQCWRDAVANGTVKFLATTAVMTGLNNRPIDYAYFRNTSTQFGVTGLWNVLPIYADDGSLAASDIFAGGSSEVDWVYVNPNGGGAISHEKSTGLCYELYFTLANSWSSRSVTCPL